MTERQQHSHLMVGIGSPHGDDQAGWLVVSELNRRLTDHTEHAGHAWKCYMAKTPSDLLDWLDDVTHLVVCDCCESPMELGALRRWHWPGDRFVRTRSSSSHHLGLSDVLDLAMCLGRLPSLVEIRTIGGSHFEPGTEPSALVRNACQDLASQLWEELTRA